MDEYGRPPRRIQDENAELREKERITERQTEREFAKKRKDKSVSHVHEFHSDAYYDKKMAEDAGNQ
jgi:hypothetical protein